MCLVLDKTVNIYIFSYIYIISSSIYYYYYTNLLAKKHYGNFEFRKLEISFFPSHFPFEKNSLMRELWGILQNKIILKWERVCNNYHNFINSKIANGDKKEISWNTLK